MTERISYQDVSAGLMDGLMKSEMYLKKSGLDLKLLELMKYRVSQINGCAYCLDMHHKEAIHMGETELRLHSLAAWRECPYYSEKERAVLAFAEALTQVSQQDISDEPSGSKAVLSREIIEEYINAIRGRDTKTLENLLSQDIVFSADGGDRLQVVRKYCKGMREVIELLIFVYHTYNISSSLVFTEINHQPALLYYEGAALRVCQVFELSADQHKIKRINSILDPDKLKNI